MSTSNNKPRNNLIIERYIKKLSKYYLKICPKLYEICYDPVNQHKRIRKAFGFILGFILGLILYNFIIADFIVNKYVSWLIRISLAILLSFGCALSIQCRCICLLIIPGLFGKAGRNVLKALILSYVIAGPIFNLSHNAKEVMRSFSCTKQLTYNLTRTRYDLMLAPFQQAMKNMNDSAAEVRKTLGSVNELMRPLVKEIEEDDEPEEEYADDLEDQEEYADEMTTTLSNNRRSKREDDTTEVPGHAENAFYYEDKYKEKITDRCKKQLRRGSDTCKKAFRDAYERCFDSVTWVAGWALCWPMKLTFVCNVVEKVGGGKICDPEGKVDLTGIGEGYATLKETRDKFNESLKDAKIEFKLNTKAIALEQAKDVGRAAAGVVRDFEARKRFLDAIINFISRCLSFVFIKIIINASNYHSKYLSDIEHDNIYVTSYFRRIDARRKARGSLTLLPLKKLERIKMIDHFSLKQSRIEKKHFYGQTAKLVLEIITVSIFVLLDKLLFELLDVIRRNARLDISQKGQHNVSLEVKGHGLVASLIRQLVRSFNRRRRISQELTNEPCLPRPRPLSRFYLLIIYMGYFTIWLLLLLQAYGQRLRHAIAAYFYRRREKRRVLYLYNETLRRRQNFLRTARIRASESARARLLAPETRVMLKLRENWPRVWRWLRFVGLGRNECVVCGDFEPRRGSMRFRVCRGPECLAAYCDECWRDLGKSCWAAGCADGALIDGNHEEVEEEEDDD